MRQVEHSTRSYSRPHKENEFSICTPSIIGEDSSVRLKIGRRCLMRKSAASYFMNCLLIFSFAYKRTIIARVNASQPFESFRREMYLIASLKTRKFRGDQCTSARPKGCLWGVHCKLYSMCRDAPIASSTQAWRTWSGLVHRCLFRHLVELTWPDIWANCSIPTWFKCTTKSIRLANWVELNPTNWVQVETF